METCVLIPPELSLVLTTTASEHRSPQNRFLEMGVRVWTNERLARGTKFYPFQGTIRLDKLEVYSYLDDNDVRNRFGCFDEVQVADKQQRGVRHCNWIRFLRCSGSPLGPDVNLLGSKVKGEPVFETTRAVAAHTELVAHLVADERTSGLGGLGVGSAANSLDLHDALSAERLANCTYREAMGMLIEHSPLDLSMALLSSRILITMPTDDADDSLSPPSDLLRPIMSRANSFSPMPRRNRERTLLPCEVCGKAFDRPSLLKRHMRTHTGEKPHVCDVCAKGFSTSSSLNTHRRIHSGEKPHMCNICGKRFTASSNLYYHRMTHNKVKPHQCTMCSKSFPTPGDLKSHMYVHSGSWPFKCHICNRGFSKQTNLRNHLFLHTGDKPHVCELCNKKFALACNLRAHLKTHEEDPQEECLKCGRQFLASTQSLVHGCCSQCYLSHQGIPLVVAKSAAHHRHSSPSPDHDPSSSSGALIQQQLDASAHDANLQRHLQMLHRESAAAMMAAAARGAPSQLRANWMFGSPLSGAGDTDEEEDEMEDDLLEEDYVEHRSPLAAPRGDRSATSATATVTRRRHDMSSDESDVHDDDDTTLTESTT